ncbi:2'-5' RNA ligase family protein [Actinomadura darangshiensis]|uniref:2'-5' RNA ligase family protein n=1 Tax=Actinomadura darangshiensis TaxID=705336 RepID=A0A4V2YVB7_9ACTN|nr:2'-5' RNA ligase family protein [Actinomadura darangshiensis]TDD80867.1 2'-5' RNA ligase family protein [Actinomadura darangshiensis]
MPERMSDHWWWRPGVRPGRHLLVWHILPDDQPEVRDLVRHCQNKLASINGLDLIPGEWLHMTTQIVGFEDEVPAEENEAMVAGTIHRLATIPPIEVEFGKLWMHSEAVMLGSRPSRALHPIRQAIRDATAQAVTVHQLDDEPDWTPHISIAYSNTDRSARPIIDALDLRPDPVPLRVAQVHLVAQQRVGHLYRWKRLTTAELKG